MIIWLHWKSWIKATRQTILDHMAGLHDLCERPYWGRLWILQELRSAKEIIIMCGSHKLPWTQFENILLEATGVSGDFAVSQRTVTELSRLEETKHVKLTAAAKMANLCSEIIPTSRWLLLQVTSHLDCYDPRDKVYALLSMTKTGAEAIDADYNSTLPQLLHRVLSNSCLHTLLQTYTTLQCAVHGSKQWWGLGQTFIGVLTSILLQRRKLVAKKSSTRIEIPDFLFLISTHAPLQSQLVLGRLETSQLRTQVSQRSGQLYSHPPYQNQQPLLSLPHHIQNAHLPTTEPHSTAAPSIAH